MARTKAHRITFLGDLQVHIPHHLHHSRKRRAWQNRGNRGSRQSRYVPFKPSYTTRELGIDGSGTIRLWVEAVAFSTELAGEWIRLYVDPDGGGSAQEFEADAVRLTAVDVDVLIGANDANDESFHDDWVGAAGHNILNFVRVQGPGNFTLPLTLEAAKPWTGPVSPVSVTGFGGGYNTGSVTTDASGVGATSFLVTGGYASTTTDDVKVQASFAGQSVGCETLTVLELSYMEEVGRLPTPLLNMDHGNIILNPAVRRNPWAVLAFDAGCPTCTGERVHTGEHYRGTVPVLNDSDGNRSQIGTKFDVASIEVAYARQIVVSGTPVAQIGRMSTDGFYTEGQSGLTVAAPGDNGGRLQSNLRITDSDMSAVGVDGNEYIYYVGHPTERVLDSGGILTNYAKKIAVPTMSDLVFRVNLHFVQYNPGIGPLLTTGLTPEERNVIKAETSRIWEQVGVRFVWGPEITTTVYNLSQWDLPNDDPGTMKALTTQDRANGIDVYLVNSILDTGNEFISGSTAYESSVWYSWEETGIVMATRQTSPTSSREDPHDLARTLAHEIGHFLMNIGNGAHDVPSHNLMRAGSVGSGNNSDLTLEQRGAISLTPSSVNSDED